MAKTKLVPLEISGLNDFVAFATSDAAAMKMVLLEKAAFIDSVTTEEDEREAVEVASQIKAIESAVEKCRKEIKAPVLDAGYAIDEAAKKYLLELTHDRKRIESALSKYIADKREDVRLANELQEQEQHEIEAERQKEQAALVAAAAKKNLPPPAPLPPPVEVPPEKIPTVAGANFREELDFEVTDIHALYAYNRRYVRLEVEKAIVKAWINLPGNEEIAPHVPGIRVFKSQKLITKAARNYTALPVEPGDLPR